MRRSPQSAAQPRYGIDSAMTRASSIDLTGDWKEVDGKPIAERG
jgi:hypothetical protein